MIETKTQPRQVPDQAARRFWSKTRRTENGCLEWSDSLDKDGYGTFKFDGLAYRAHRFAWLLAYGPISDGLLCCHTCDNAACVEPSHLYEGTPAQNMRDKLERGRCGQRRKTHCPRGHAYTPENTRINRMGGRSCKRCNLDQINEHRRINGRKK